MLFKGTLSETTKATEPCCAYHNLLYNYDRNTDELLHSLNWHKHAHQRAVSKSIMMYNAVNNQTPNYLSSRFFFLFFFLLTIS